MAKFFNLILDTSLYPEKWNHSFIIPIFKSGDTSNLSNYRGISLTNCLSKIFNSIINKRLLKLYENEINPAQFGFRKNNRTSDSLFIVKTLLNKYVNNEKKKVFGCFIDLKKAFDSVWRKGLLYKLSKKEDIGDKLYKVIKNMYNNTTASVKSKNLLSKHVTIERGVKQGDNLSSLLFNIYINDIPEIFNHQCNPVTLENMSLNCLMFADDVLLLSESQEGLQNSINMLNDYCLKWQLSINIKKTKIMVFQQRNILDKKNNFFLNGEKIEKVLQYKYLGNIIESSGKFHSSHLELSKKGNKVMFSMFKYLNPISNVPLGIYKKLFESLVRPIVTYNSDIWYMDFYEKIIQSSNRNKNNSKFDIISLIDSSFAEKTNLKFCKFVLGLSRQSVNIAARAELAQYPIDTFIKTQSIKYLIRLLNHTSNPLLDDAFLLSKKLDSMGTYSWFSYITYICSSNNINLNHFKNLNYLKCSNIINRIKQTLKTNYEKAFFDKLKSSTESNKIYLYSKMKTKYIIEDYIKQTNFENRKNICKMRICDHFLELERGRFQNIKREKRICKFCKANVVEDEAHFFFNCHKYTSIREEFKKQNINTFELENIKNETEKLINILSSPDHLQHVAPFIKKSLILRKVEK